MNQVFLVSLLFEKAKDGGGGGGRLSDWFDSEGWGGEGAYPIGLTS